MTRKHLTRALFTLAILVTLLILFDLGPAPYPGPPTLFEDGSFVLYDLSGCIPWDICHLR